ncbi:hypothetical protein EC988_000814, partial [Linderina pennispora]
MGGSKKVQASLSSFFKSKRAPADDVPSKRPSAAASEDGDMDVDEQLTIIAETPKKRTRVISDDDMDDDYVDGQQASAGAKSRPPVARKSLSELHCRSDTQQATLVKSVSDTSDLAERMRERIRENGLSQGSGGMATGTVEGTSIQLVERKKGVKYTPLEMQVLDMKTKHPDILLAVEVGYKYR